MSYMSNSSGMDEVDGDATQRIPYSGTGLDNNMHHAKEQNRYDNKFDSGLGTSSFSSESSPSLTAASDMMARLQLATRVYQEKQRPRDVTDEAYVSCESTEPFLKSGINAESKIEQPIYKKFEEPIDNLFLQDEDGDTKLHIAIAQCASDVVTQIISMAPSPDHLNKSNGQKLTPLHLAVLTSQPEVARDLLRHGAVLEARDEDGNTALHLACHLGLEDCVRALTIPLSSTEAIMLPFQAIPQDMDIKNYEGYTCMHLAAQQTETRVLAHLYSAVVGADVNARDGLSGRTVLHHAADVGNFHLTQFLVAFRNLNVNAKAYNGCSPLQLAAGRGHHQLMEFLMNAGASRPSTVSSDESESNTSDDEMMDSFDDFQINSHS